MKKDAVKRDSILNQLKNHPIIEAELIEACEGKKLRESDLNKLGYNFFKEKYRSFGTLPAFGCAVSHISVYDKIISNGDQFALVLEDDVLLGKDLSQAIPYIKDFLENTTEPIAVLLTPDFIYNLKDEVILQFNKHRIVNFVTGYMTTGYIINNSAARLLSENLRPIKHVADDWNAFKRYGLKVFGIVPHLVSYSGELGEIGLSQRPHKEPIAKQLRHALGRIKARVFELIKYLKGFRRSKKLW